MAYPKYSKLKVLILIIIFLTSNVVWCQCTNTKLNPSTNVEASAFNDTVVISTESYAGDYFIIEKLCIGETFIFSSSNVEDYITIRDKDGLILLEHGPTPLSYTVSGADKVSVHINLATPSCGTESENRTTFAQCASCPPVPPKVVIESILEVSGILTVGDIAIPPVAGMIRWNDMTNDFEGFDGEKWRSLTRQKAWGTTPIFDRNENQKVTAPVGSLGDRFGVSVSISGDYAIVGAYYEAVGTNENQGAAYIFKRTGTTWTQQAQLTADDGSADDSFGYSVSISGEYAIIGAIADNIGGNNNQGSAYIYERNNSIWTQQTKLTSAIGNVNDYFGSSVSISGDYAIVGSPYYDVGGNGNQGSAFVFLRDGNIWTQQAQLTAANGSAGDSFGSSVSISGDYVIVAAEFDDVGANLSQGSAFIFIKTGTMWTQQSELAAADGSTLYRFGNSVSISGDYVIVGASLDNVGANDFQGSAYIFIRTGTIWTQQAHLTATDGNESDRFGHFVSISGDYAIVGSDYDDVGTNDDQGSAYLFVRNDTTWTQQVLLTAADGSASDNFGYSVALSGDYAIIGAFGDDVGPNIDQGSAYFFNK